MISRRKLILMLTITVVYFFSDTLFKAGYFKQITNTKLESNEIIRGIYGPEDMEWDNENNVIYVSSSDRRSTYKGIWKSSDGVYQLNPLSGEFHKMHTNWDKEFHPHGISYFQESGQKYLYTVNHFKTENSIELFCIRADSLIHIKSYAHALLHSPNDVVGVGVDQFYATNDHGNTSRLGVQVENYLRMPYSYLVYYDGTKYIKALEGLVYANGVQISNDDSSLFVSHTIGREIIVLDRNRITGELFEVERINMLAGVDNINVDHENNLWVAAHPQLLKFSSHANDSSNHSPSQVYKLTPSQNGYQVKKTFESDGALISGSSVALFAQGKLYIGGVFDDKIVSFTP